MGCVACWPMDGNGDDVSGNMLDGTVHNSTTTTGKYGQCYQFNGVTGSSGSRVLVPAYPQSAALTMSAWIYIDEYPAGGTYTAAHTIISRRQNNADQFFYMDSTGHIGFHALRGAGHPSNHVLSSIAVPLHQWHHIAGTMDDEYTRVYLDGQLAEETASCGPIYWDGGYYCTNIGVHSDNSVYWHPMKGLIDEVAIFNRALTQTEIFQLAHDVNANAIADLWESTASNPPDQPYNISPAAGSSGLQPLLTLSASVFNDLNTTDTHAASQWQARRSFSPADYSSPAFDTGATATYLTAYPIPDGGLDYSTSYYWRVRYQDSRGLWSTWSSETDFSTGEVTSSTGRMPKWNPQVIGFLEDKQVPMFWQGMAFPNTCFGDIDGDGDFDMLLGSVYRLALFRNDGTPQNAHFTLLTEDLLNSDPTETSSVPEPYFSPALGDLDGDGDLDLIVGQNTTTKGRALCFYRNTGTPTSFKWEFEDSTAIPSYPSIDNHLHPELGDFNGDGLPDMVVGKGLHNSGLELLWHVNTGTPTSPNLTTTISVPITPSPFTNLPGADESGPYPRLCDIDGDGDLDLFLGFIVDATSPQEFFMRFYRNVGDAQNPDYIEDSSVLEGMGHQNTSSWAPSLVDLNGDHTYDLAAGENGGKLHFFSNTGTSNSPAFKAEGTTFFLDVVDRSKPAFADLDDDGDLDMLIGGNSNPGVPGNGRIHYFENVGNPLFPRWKHISEQYAGITDASLGYSEYFHPAFADYDGDGMDELYVALLREGIIRQYTNTGTKKNPEWTQTSPKFLDIQYGQHAYPNQRYIYITFADLDGDNWTDLIIGEGPKDEHDSWSWDLPNIWFYRNLGNGSAEAPVSIIPISQILPPYPGGIPEWGSKSAAPAFADFDGDGDLDLLLGVGYARLNYWKDQIHYFENIGDCRDFSFIRRLTDYIPGSNMLYNAYPVLSDINGDGNQDMFIGGKWGGVRCYINESPVLSISPQSATVPGGEGLGLTVTGNAGNVTWVISVNRSGAVLTPTGTEALYTAGTTFGVIDVIECVDTSGTLGRAYVNVISPTQISASGKAVIMAGRKPDDTLWDSTNVLAHFVYRTLLYRGFSKENIYYLSCDMNQDVDGDGLFNDIDAASSLNNIQYTLTTWAQGSPNLFIYLIDHGQEQSDDVYIRCNETDVLYASTLNQWLNDLQESGTDMLTLIVDCCQSGGFISQCHATGAQQRIVIASTDSMEPAFFSAGGLISFTATFVNALYSGLSVGHAFDLAAGAMDRYQRPQLDDDGNGVYHKDTDGELARTVTLGATFIAGADRPQIGQVSPNQTLTENITDATIWASEVSSVYPVNRVWATIAPPDFIPGAQTDPASPVLGLPCMELAWNAGTNRYEATTGTFTMLGAYAVNLYAEDIWGGVSYPKQVYVNQVQSDERIIIVCGDGDHDDDSPWEFSDYLAEAVYNTAKARWLDDSRITYLSSGAHAGVDQPPTKANLLTAIGAASGISKLTIYMIGKGNSSALDIDGDGPDVEDLRPEELNAALNILQETGETCVIAVLDFHQSGAWIAPLQAPPGRERIIITSCSADEAAWCEGGGIVSFSQWFFSRIFSGTNIRDAFNWSRSAMRGITSNRQNPQLDDDGSGVSDWHDGALAVNTYIGAAFVTGSGAPVINDYAKHVKLQSRTATLWASGVWAESGLEEVFAYLVPPETTSENGQVLKITFSYNALTGRYEANYDQFNPSQYYEIIYYARGRKGELSRPYKTTLHGWGTHDIYDKYFDDHDAGTLNYSSASGSIQMHNFEEKGDVDVIVFHADPDKWYSVGVMEQARNCDAALYLYADDISGDPLDMRDDAGPGGDDELLSWYSGSRSGPMYVKIAQSQQSPDLFGDETTYTLRLSGDWGPSAGLATITMAVDTIGPDGGVLKAGENGIYSKPQITIPAGGLTQERELIIKSPGDIGNNPYFDFTKEWFASHPSNASIAMILSDPVDFEIPAKLTLQFIDNGPTFEDFTIDDVPEDASLSDMRIYSWTGSQWNVLPGEHIIEADTVSVEIGSLTGRAIFAVAPFTDTRVASWWLY